MGFFMKVISNMIDQFFCAKLMENTAMRLLLFFNLRISTMPAPFFCKILTKT